MSTIASKILTLGIAAALGGFGLIAGPAVDGRLPSFAGDPGEAQPPGMVELAHAIEDSEDGEGAVEASELAALPAEAAPATRARGASELAHARRDAVYPGARSPSFGGPAERAAGERRPAHVRHVPLARGSRDAVRALNQSARAARNAERPEPGQGERGLGAERRTAARAIGAARREAIQALNAAHREGIRQLAARAERTDSARGQTQRGRAQRATHAR